jgi:SNF2 family DNA or RNA helicase
VKALTPRYRLVLTGTPMENRLEELASVLDWVDDVALAPKWRLNAWHTTDEGDGGRGITGARNLDALRERLRPCMVRRIRKDVLSQLPSRADTRVPVPMTEQQRGEHDLLGPMISAIASRARARALTQPEFLRLMQLLTKQRMISNGLGQLRFEELWPTYQHARPDEALLEGLFSPKLLELRRLIDELALRQERKVVVFSQWRRMLRLAEWSVRDQLTDQGLRAVFFTGAESQRLRSQAIIDFHDDPAVRVMFLSDAGGVGLNLQRAASVCINLELPWNPAVLEQRIGRIYRLGQKRPIDVYNLASEYGIESRIADLVANKKALFNGLFDGTSDAVQFAEASSFMNDVEKIVAAVPEVSAPEAADFEGQEEADDVTSDESPMTETVAPAPSVAQLFAGVQLRRTGGGGVVIEATPEAASSLVAMFEGMAKLLAGAAREVPRG